MRNFFIGGGQAVHVPLVRANVASKSLIERDVVVQAIKRVWVNFTEIHGIECLPVLGDRDKQVVALLLELGLKVFQTELLDGGRPLSPHYHCLGVHVGLLRDHWLEHLCRCRFMSRHVT